MYFNVPYTSVVTVVIFTQCITGFGDLWLKNFPSHHLTNVSPKDLSRPITNIRQKRWTTVVLTTYIEIIRGHKNKTFPPIVGTNVPMTFLIHVIKYICGFCHGSWVSYELFTIEKDRIVSFSKEIGWYSPRHNLRLLFLVPDLKKRYYTIIRSLMLFFMCDWRRHVKQFLNYDVLWPY